MAGLVHSIEELVGRTPLMELDRFERQQQCGAHLLAKLEFFNPTGSVKDRAALSMIQAAEASGHLAPGGAVQGLTQHVAHGDGGAEQDVCVPGHRAVKVFLDGGLGI